MMVLFQAIQIDSTELIGSTIWLNWMQCFKCIVFCRGFKEKFDINVDVDVIYFQFH